MKTETLETCAPFLSFLLAAGFAEQGAFLLCAMEAPASLSTLWSSLERRWLGSVRGSAGHPQTGKPALETVSGPASKTCAWCQTTSGMVAPALPCPP